MSGLINSAGSRSGVIGTTELDYEEGTWTPTFFIETGSNFSYDVQTGYYTKVGRLVHVTAKLQIDKVAGTNNIILKSFPFSPAYSTSMPILISDYNISGGGVTMGNLYTASTGMTLGHVTNNGDWDDGNNGANLANTTNILIYINFSYYT